MEIIGKAQLHSSPHLTLVRAFVSDKFISWNILGALYMMEVIGCTQLNLPPPLNPFWSLRARLTFSFTRFLRGFNLSIWLYAIHNCSNVSEAASTPCRDFNAFLPRDKIFRLLKDCKFWIFWIMLVERESFSRLTSRWKGPSIFSIGGDTPTSLISFESAAFLPVASSHRLRACLIEVGIINISVEGFSKAS